MRSIKRIGDRPDLPTEPTPQKAKSETDAKYLESLFEIDYLTFPIVDFEEGFLQRSAAKALFKMAFVSTKTRDSGAHLKKAFSN